MRLIGYFLLLICLSSEVLAKDIVDDDPRRTVLLEQPRLEVISTILETYYDKGSAEDLYKIYKSEPSAFEEMHVDSRTSDGQKFSRIFKFRNPNGWDKAPTEVRFWERLDGEDISFLSLLGLTETPADRELKKLKKNIAKLPPYAPNNSSANTQSGQSPNVMPSSIQLKAIQTRKFNKSPWEIVKAITENFKDKNGICYITPPGFTPVGFNPVTKNGVTKISTDKYAVSNGVGTCYFTNNPSIQYEFEISAKPPKPIGNDPLWYDQGLVYGTPTLYSIDSCNVRVRIKNGQNQIYDLKTYQNIFKEIADQAFIEAIEIDPAQME